MTEDESIKEPTEGKPQTSCMSEEELIRRMQLRWSAMQHKKDDRRQDIHDIKRNLLYAYTEWVYLKRLWEDGFIPEVPKTGDEKHGIDIDEWLLEMETLLLEMLDLSNTEFVLQASGLLSRQWWQDAVRTSQKYHKYIPRFQKLKESEGETDGGDDTVRDAD